MDDYSNVKVHKNLSVKKSSVNIVNRRFFKVTPARIIVIGFLCLVFAGGLILYMPISSNGGYNVTFSESLFTSVSAVCVTGLVVVDTNVTWSLFGKIVIIILIQTGGLGIMSFATMFSIITGKKMGLLQRLTIQESTNNFSLTEIVSVFKGILLVTVIIETIGAVIISTRLIPIYGFWEGLGKSFFHSVSAFCNAGFDIFGEVDNKYISLVEFNKSPVMLITTSFLIIIGGLGFIVWNDIASKRRFSRFSLHTKVVISGTLFLIIFGTVSFLIFEFNNPGTIKDMTLPQKIMNCYFHSVTTRTAGFNSIPISNTKETTNLFTIILMYIGAAPGSTAGGIKVSTFFVIVLTVVSFIKGKEDIQVFERRISNTVKTKAISIMALSGTLIIFCTVIMLYNNEGKFMNILYEATSAFGTVGLTTGITPELNLLDRYLLMISMFLGRVGPLTALVAFTTIKDIKSFSYRYPEGKITVG